MRFQYVFHFNFEFPIFQFLARISEFYENADFGKALIEYAKFAKFEDISVKNNVNSFGGCDGDRLLDVLKCEVEVQLIPTCTAGKCSLEPILGGTIPTIFSGISISNR